LHPHEDTAILVSMYKIFFAIVALCVPVASHAHTRWFAEGATPQLIDEPTALYLGAWVIIGAIVVTIGILLQKRDLLQLRFLRPKASHAAERAASTFTMVAGAFFIIAGTHNYLFSPNLTAESGIPSILIYIQIAIGLMFLVGIGTRISGLILASMWAVAIYYAGALALIENIWVLSTAAFIVIMGNDYFSLIGFSILREVFEPFKKYGLSILRIGTGLTLLILGFSEKIFAPEFGLSFLEQHPWNFMQLLGLPYSDYLFVLSAGSIEILLGLVLILGIVTRLNALVIAVIFSLPLFILGPIELAGHLPHFAAVILLIIFGNGGYCTLLKKGKEFWMSK